LESQLCTLLLGFYRTLKIWNKSSNVITQVLLVLLLESCILFAFSWSACHLRFVAFSWVFFVCSLLHESRLICLRFSWTFLCVSSSIGLRFLCHCSFFFSIEHGTFATLSNISFHRFFSQTKSNNVTSSNNNWTPNPNPFSWTFVWCWFVNFYWKTKRRWKECKIRCFRMCGVRNFHGLSWWWMHMRRCIK
jgi:hypothetical protein